jgi:RNA polymerase sigma-70 factor (ECF subfamily)
MPGVVDEQEMDRRFIERLKRRDEQAFNQLVLTYEAQVLRLVWRMLGTREEAEDMAQEVFVQVFRSIDNFRGDSKISTWIYRIAMNLTKNRTKYLARRYQRNHSDIDGAEPREAHNEARGRTSGETHRPDLDAMGNEAERIVIECLHQMDSEFREILVLRDVESLSYEEVGAITGLAAGTVKSRLHRARSLLKAQVEARLKGDSDD